ncbi:hypothetical protein XCR_1732 [Xanthomonas campestris pv. raphani 756C]|nr:hypothetical protein XCR_1732 [Xanthomonas campestris pv. raphani 756C]
MRFGAPHSACAPLRLHATIEYRHPTTRLPMQEVCSDAWIAHVTCG